MAGRMIDPNGSMCGIGLRVSRPACLRGVVAEPRRDHAVAHLVEDHRHDEAAEEHERLLEIGAHGAGRRSATLRRAVDAERGRRHGLEPGLADALVARLALAVRAGVELGQRFVDVGEGLAELAGERLDLAPLGGDLARVGEVLVEVELGVGRRGPAGAAAPAAARAPPATGRAAPRRTSRPCPECTAGRRCRPRAGRLPRLRPRPGPGMGERRRRPVGARATPWCTPGWSTGWRGPAAPAPPGCRRRGRACGWRTSAAARAGTGDRRARPGRPRPARSATPPAG